MSITKFPELLGLTNTDSALINAIAENGGDVTQLSPKKVRELGSDFVFLPAKGVVLSFATRAKFESSYDTTPRGDGPYVLTTMFCYPYGSEHVDAYVDIAPLSECVVRDRKDALAAYGEPARTKGSDDEVVWDQWRLNGIQVRTTYDDERSVLTISVSIPMA